MNDRIGAIAVVIALLFGALSSYFLTKSHFKAKLEVLAPKVEQVYIRDTIVEIKPIYKTNRIIDTIRIAVTDTLFRTDTLYLPREQRVYEDSTYRAYVSGVHPSLDSIFVFRNTIVQTKIATQKEWRRFSFGLQGGVGLVFPCHQNPTFGGYIGFGVGIAF